MMSSRVSIAWTVIGSAVRCEDESTCGDTGTRCHQYVFDVVDLVVRRAANLAHPFGDAVHAVDVGLAEQAAVGVDRERSTEREVLDCREIFRFPAATEPELFQLREHERGEVVV